MTDRAQQGARIQQEGDHWILVLTRDLKHSPEKVWQALTDPAELTQWAPFDADASLGTAGRSVRLTTAGAPGVPASETKVKRAEAPKLLVYDWGGREMRWELEPTRDGTHLTLWTSIDRGFIAMGAAGWHLCFDVLDHLLGGAPTGRMVAGDALKSAEWQRLHAEYKAQFDREAQ